MKHLQLCITIILWGFNPIGLWAQDFLTDSTIWHKQWPNQVKTAIWQQHKATQHSIQLFLRQPNNQHQAFYREILLDILSQKNAQMTQPDRNQWKSHYAITEKQTPMGLMWIFAADKAPKTTELIATVVTKPAVDEASFEASLNKIKQKYQTESDNHYKQIERFEPYVFNKNLRPNWVQQLNQLHFDGFGQFLQAYYQPNNFIFTFVGDSTIEQTHQLLKQKLAAIVAAQNYSYNNKPAALNDTAHYYFIPTTDDHLHANYLLPMNIGFASPDLVPLQLVATVLGENMNQLTTVQQKSSFYFNDTHSYWAFQDTRKADALQWFYRVEELIDKLLEIDDKEIQKNVELLIENIQKNAPYSFHEYLGWQVALEKENLFFFNQLNKTQNIKPNQFVQLINQHINKALAVKIIHGNRHEIIPHLLNYTPKAAASFWTANGKKLRYFQKNYGAQQVIQAFSDSIGGLANIEKIKNLTIRMKGYVVNNNDTLNINVTTFRKNNTLFYSLQKLDTLLIRKQIFNNQHGYQQTMHDTLWLQNDSLYHLWQQTFSFNELYLNTLNTGANLLAVVLKGNTYYFELLFADKHQNQIRQYYNFESLLKEKSEVVKFKTKLKEISFFNDYKSFNNVKFPTSLVRFVNMYRIDFKNIEYDTRTKIPKKQFEIPAPASPTKK